MNIAKKIFCRVYQFAFHIALPFLPYREPHILKSTDEIADEMKKKNLKTVLIVTDEFLKKSGATKRLEESFRNNNLEYYIYDKTRPNPTVDNVEEAFGIYISKKCECLVAFGGGSAMDCAKAVGARKAYPKRNLDKLKGNLKIFRKIPPLFSVPTTSGTGSEVTVTAVITDTKKKHKYTMNSFPLIPGYAVLDPCVTYSLPGYLTATTGMDALTHAVEVYIGRSTSKETRMLSKEAVKLVFENIQIAYDEPENYKARESMLNAAYKAGMAFSKSYVGYVHAVAHSLGGQYNVPHGFANTILLPVVLREYGEKIHNKLYELSLYCNIADNNDTISEGAEKFIRKIESLNEYMDIPKTISQIKKEDIPTMAKYADKEGNPLYPVPVLMDSKELEKIYYLVSDWSKI